MLIESVYNTLRFMFQHSDTGIRLHAVEFESVVVDRVYREEYPTDDTLDVIRDTSIDDVLLACACYAARQDDTADYDELAELVGHAAEGPMQGMNLWNRLVHSTVFHNAIGKVLWDKSSNDERLIVVATEY